MKILLKCQVDLLEQEEVVLKKDSYIMHVLCISFRFPFSCYRARTEIKLWQKGLA